MEKFVFEETRLANCGYLPALECLPMRNRGEGADAWLDRCDQAVIDRMFRKIIDRDLAERAMACAEVIAAELRRYPKMVSWCHREYYAAANNYIHPNDDRARYRAAAATVMPYEAAHEAFISTVLFEAMAGYETA